MKLLTRSRSKTCPEDLRLVAAIVMLTVTLAMAPHAAAAVEAEPGEVTFTSLQDQSTIQLKSGGEALPGSAVQEWKLYVNEHDYDHMVEVQKGDEALTVSPSGDMEVGTYTLEIQTAKGKAEVKVHAPLTTLESIVERKAEQTGITVQQARDRFGLTSESPRADIMLDVPPIYYEGQVLTLAVPATPGQTHEWLVNGDVVHEGPNALTFALLFADTGDYFIGYRARKGDAITASDVAYTTVLSLPPTVIETNEGQTVQLQAPRGYQKYTWMMATGPVLGSGRILRHKFDTPGIHRVVCRAEKAGPGYAKFPYELTVK